MAVSKKLLLIGWDAADWKVITPLLDSGQMPNLQGLIERGVMGNMATLQPVLSPMLWTSIATGKRAFKHGIHGFSEPDPRNGSIRPITNLSRKTKAVWNILSQNGLRTHVLGWWPSHPAEPINGVMVSNHYQQAKAALDKPWPVRPGTIHPPEMASKLAECRIHPWEIDGDLLRLFVPDAPQVDQKKDQRLMSIAKIVAECSGIHAAATRVMTSEPWDFMGVYYDGIDHFGHGFMRYHPPRPAWVPEADFERYKLVIDGAYCYHDLMLGTLLALAGEETTVILMSDHGFHPDHLRPRVLPNEPAGPAAEHRPFGIFVAAGPNIRRDELVFGATLLDVCPTILRHFGLPVGRDMDGRVLTTIFKEPPPLEAIDSWDAVEGPHPAGQHPPDAQLSAVENQEAIAQLVALGYIEQPAADQQTAVKETVRELRYNLARAYADAQYHQEAAEILRELWTEWPDESRFGVHLLPLLLALGDTAQARTVLEQIETSKAQYAQTAAAELKELEEKLKAEEKPEEKEPDRKTMHKLRKLRARAHTNVHALAYLRGSLLAAERRYGEAVAELTKAAGAQMSNRPSVLHKLGEVHLAQRNWAQAEAEFKKGLALDPINPAFRLGLAEVAFRRRDYAQAATEAMAAAGQRFFNPRAHFLAGFAWHRQGDPEQAMQLLQTAVAQNPAFPQAHRLLARLHRTHRRDWPAAAEHLRLAKEGRRRIRQWRLGLARPTPAERVDRGPKASEEQAEAEPTSMPAPRELPGSHLGPAWPEKPTAEVVTIVAGLPRTGTSMMMQMLAAGGLEPLTDGERAADTDNPRGYFEFTPATKLRHDKAWVPQARGKVVKLVAQLLPFLPIDQSYRVVFMHRDLREVIASQQAMLERLGRKGAQLPPAKLAAVLDRQVAELVNWLERRPYVKVLHCEYGQVVAAPAETGARLREFLGESFDVAAAAAAVDPSLRRQVSGPGR